MRLADEIKRRQFDKEFEEDILMHEAKLGAVRKIKSKRDFELKHGIEGEMVYKYDLPVVNKAIEFRS
jgi:hypothetical protein